MPSAALRRAPVALLVLGLAAPLSPSCGSGFKQKPVHPVSGKVSLGGRPVEGALVVFHPVTDADQKEYWRNGFPNARTGKDGTYQLSTYGHNDGAPAGSYEITIEWRGGTGGEETGELPDRLEGRYSDPKRSGLKKDVTAGPNTIDLPLR